MTTQDEPGRGHHLVAFDAGGRERPDAGGVDSSALVERFERERPSDVFLLSHGWNGDVPAARRQYEAWAGAMDACPGDRADAEARRGGFRPAVIGVHWPSRAWGDETFDSGSFAVPPGGGAAGGGADWAAALAEQASSGAAEPDSARESVRTIVDSALDDPVPATLPASVRSAYARLDSALGIGAAGEGAAPAEDRAPFDPEEVYQACLMAEFASFGEVSLGGVLAPLRVLTFWHMKRRAAEVGASGVADLVRRLQDAAPDARFHLMGHSFGCIVVSAAIAGRPSSARRPVDSVTLVQGAMSMWSYCSSIPSAPERAGYYRRIVEDRLVDGPIVVTTSVHDRAVSTFYPIGAGSRGQVEYAPGSLPTYGAIGAFGLRGPGLDVVDDEMHPLDRPYAFEPGTVTVLRSDDVIRERRGLMGAHSDIAKPEVAHAVWSAALAG